jgi:UDP-N-acetylmuramoylalanine--D-glutamate ligase
MTPSKPVNPELRGRRVVVVGLGRSGLAAAKLCHRAGARVVGTDSAAETPFAEALSDLGIETRVGDLGADAARSAELVVVSPGVPDLPVFGDCERRGIPSEPELTTLATAAASRVSSR